MRGARAGGLGPGARADLEKLLLAQPARTRLPCGWGAAPSPPQRPWHQGQDPPAAPRHPPLAGAAARPPPSIAWPLPNTRRGGRNKSTTQGAIPGPWHLRNLRRGEPRRSHGRLPGRRQPAKRAVAGWHPAGAWLGRGRHDALRQVAAATCKTPARARQVPPHHVPPRPDASRRVPLPVAPGAREGTGLLRHRRALHGCLRRWRQQTCVTARAASGSSHFPLDLGHHATISATASAAS